MSTSNCNVDEHELVALLGGEASNDDRGELREHVSTCEACSAELRAVKEVWHGLPSAPPVEVPAVARESVLAHARDAVAGRAGVMGDLWRTVRPVVLPATAGMAAAVVVVLVLHLGAALAVRRHLPVLALGLGLAALLSGAAGGLWNPASRRTTRSVLLGGLGSLAGYLILSLLHPIPSTVEYCQVRIFRDPAMSLGEICLVYAGVAALYAGVPVALTAFASSGGEGWRVGLAEAAVFTFLALPVLGLQFGLENAAITATVLAGAALGAAAGGFAGGLVRDERTRRAAAT